MSLLSGLKLDARQQLIASLPSDFPDSFFGPPPVENSAAPAVTAPAVDGQGVGTCLSNLDLNGKLVKRGVTVSYHGLRYVVTRVNRGHFHGRRVGLAGSVFTTERMRCESVQVVY